MYEDKKQNLTSTPEFSSLFRLVTAPRVTKIL